MGKNRTYTVEFKESSAKLAVSSEQSITKTAHDLGISVSTLATWINKYAPSQKSSSKLKNSTATEELLLLRKENSKLRQERDILKKAAAYFAKETL